LVFDSASLNALSEDGNTVSSFTVRLTWVPISDVVVDFSSLNGGLVYTPARVSFTDASFDEAVTVVVHAVDDDVDQGESHADAVILTVMSLDSFRKCSRAGRSNCGQSASYNGLAVDMIDALIADDDAAGVELIKSDSDSTAACNARYATVEHFNPSPGASARLHFGEIEMFDENGALLEIQSHTSSGHENGWGGATYDGVGGSTYLLMWYSGDSAWIKVRLIHLTAAFCWRDDD
jgi:hypothetical protein